MKRIAAPMVGGLVTSTILTLLIIPAVYVIWKWHADIKPGLRKAVPSQDLPPAESGITLAPTQ